MLRVRSIYANDFEQLYNSLVLEAEWVETLERDLLPEEELLRAVLINGYLTATMQCAAITGNEIEKARRWIESEESDGLFSFESICHVLGYPADRLRRGIKAMPEFHKEAKSKHWQDKKAA